MSYTLQILPTFQTIEVPENVTLAQALREAGVMLDMPCGGRGTCGKCRVKLNGESVLACQTQITSDSTVEVSDSTCRSFDIQKNSIESDSLGVAVDIGTTTVETRLVDLGSGKVVASLSELNAQKAFGADVISRIHFEQTQGESGRKALSDTIVGQVQNLIDQYCGRLEIEKSRLERVSVTGNTAMLTWFVGESGLSLGTVPFAPSIPMSGQILSAQQIGLTIPKAKVIIPPVIAGFLGGDILGVVSRCLQMEEGQTNRTSRRWLALDIGTNGEMAIYHDGTLVAASTAAGPALEGAGISIGQKALPGAVNSVHVNEDGELTWTTIESAPPTGVCGSGLLDLISCLLKTGDLQANGKLIIPPQAPLNITQKDVRQVQLACGAIRTGVTALLESVGVTLSDLDAVYIAGGFGCHLSVSSLFDVGILPPGRKEQVRFLGNLALEAATNLLRVDNVSDTLARENQIARSITAINLAELPDFTQKFMQSMKFPTPVTNI